MNNWPKVSTPDLIRNCARHWRKTEFACPTCHRAVFRHTAATGNFFTYLRCPTCPENFLAKDAMRLFDKSGQRMLDELARRMPSITEPESDNSPVL